MRLDEATNFFKFGNFTVNFIFYILFFEIISFYNEGSYFNNISIFFILFLFRLTDFIFFFHGEFEK